MSITAAVRASLTKLGLDSQADFTTGDIFRVRDDLASRNIDVHPGDIIQALVDIEKLRPAPAQRRALSTAEVPCACTHGGARNGVIDVRLSVPPTPVERTKVAIAKAFAAEGIPISYLVGEGPRSTNIDVYLRGDFNEATTTLNALGFTKRTIDDINYGRAAHMDPDTGVVINLVYDNAISGGRDI